MVEVDFSGNYLNADTCKEGDIATITGAGSLSEKEFNGKKTTQLDLPVLINGKQKIYSPNQSNGKKLQKAFGNNTDTWTNQKFTVHIVKVKINGQVKDTLEIEPLVTTAA